MTGSFIHPAAWFIGLALILPFLRGDSWWRWLLPIPAIAAFINVVTADHGLYGYIPYLGQFLILGRVDRLSLVFAHVFAIQAFIGIVVKAVDEAAALGVLAYEVARPAIVHALESERRADAYAAWTIRMQKAAESRLMCERDRLPELGVVALSTYAPFLSLSEVEAAHWAAVRERRP